MKKVLVADHPAAIPMMLEMLGNRFDVAICTSLNQAIDMLGDKIGLIICGAHFDHGRMPDLLCAAKTHPDVAPIPFLGVRLLDQRLDDNANEAVQAAVSMLGSDGMLDIAKWKRSVGEEYAKAKLRICVDYIALNQRQIDHRDGERRKERLRRSDAAYA